MKILAHLFVPGFHNNHHPHAIRHLGLYAIFYLLLIVTFIYNGLTPGVSKVLGFATEISSTQVIEYTNQRRDSQGLSPLSNNPQLAAAAEAKAKFMFEKDFWAHNSPDGITPWFFIEQAGYEYSTAGENLARDFNTSNAVVQAWMDSPGHRANILNQNYTEIGIAVVNGKLGGKDTTLVVQMFGRPIVTAPKPQESAPTAPSQPSTPTQVVPTERAVPVDVNQELILPNDSRPTRGVVIGDQRVPEKYLPAVPRFLTLATSLTTLQKVYLTMLTVLMAAFLFDAYLLYRKRIVRYSSHSLTHSLIIIIAIVSIIFSGNGLVG